MNPDDYVLRVRSLDPAIIAVAPSPKESQPRVIAIGHGEGELLQVRFRETVFINKIVMIQNNE